MIPPFRYGGLDFNNEELYPESSCDDSSETTMKLMESASSNVAGSSLTAADMNQSQDTRALSLALNVPPGC